LGRIQPGDYKIINTGGNQTRNLGSKRFEGTKKTWEHDFKEQITKQDEVIKLE
jgi:hypothetical protein